MIEQQIINQILNNFKRSKNQINAPFECDAEIIRLNNKLIAVTMDEFSSEEDMFDNMPPFNLGENLAVATLSDLFACSAKPEFFIHSIVIGKETNLQFIDELTKGISSILNQTNCLLIGGDLGHGSSWRYTATAIGSLDSNKYLSRILPQEKQSIWVTGKLGDANLAAFTKNIAPSFELRLKESQYIKDNALSCIDTSGGLAESLWILKSLNNNLSFEINTSSIPIDKKTIKFCEENNIPPLAFIYGGAGEYELLFTLPINLTPDINATRIGTVNKSKNSELLFNHKNNSIKITQAPPCPRNIKNRDEYIQAILKQVQDVYR